MTLVLCKVSFWIDELPLASASGKDLPEGLGLSRIIWLKPKSFGSFCPPAKAGGNLIIFLYAALVFDENRMQPVIEMSRTRS